MGCGFCEKVCPVLGTSAIVVEGIQPQTKIERQKDSFITNFFLETIGDWEGVASPNITKERTGSMNILMEVQNLLSYSFIRVS